MPTRLCKPLPVLVVLEPEDTISEILKHINKPRHTNLVPCDMNRDYFLSVHPWCIVHSGPYCQMLRVYHPLPITKTGLTSFENIKTVVVGGVERRCFILHSQIYVSQD